MLKKLSLFMLPLAVCSAAELYVDANAKAAGNGSADRPFATVQQAADKVKPGDTVIIRPGVYFETVRLKRFGTADAPVTFKADKVKKNRVIITGADKAIRTKAKKWQCVDKALGIYSIKTANANPPRVLYSGVDLFCYKTLDALKKFEARPGVPGPRHGFFFQKSTEKLFVRLRPDGKYGSTDPNEHIMAVAPTRENNMGAENPDSKFYNFGILGTPGKSCNVIIDGITFETPARTAIYVCGNDVTVRNSLFLGCMAGGVSGRYIEENFSSRNAKASNNVTVENCEWHNFPIYDDVAELIELVKSGKIVIKNAKDRRHHYWVHKSPVNGALFYYETGVIRNIGKNWILRNCYIHDVFDGIANMNWAENTIIEDNIFEKCIDNAIETENHSKNCHFRRNRCIDIFQSVSYQPLGGLPWPGPVYVYQNLFYRTPANIFKTGSSSTFKIGIVEKQANNRINKGKKELANYDWKNITIPGGLHIFNNTIVEPQIRIAGDLGGTDQHLNGINFSNNIAISGLMSHNVRRPGNGGVKAYNYTNNAFVFTSNTKVYPLFPAIAKQVSKDPAKVLPGWQELSFVPAKFTPAVKIPGLPVQFKYIGAFQKADEKIAGNAGIIEDDVPEIKQQVSTAKCEEKSEPVKAEKTAKTVKISDAVRLEWNIRNQVDSAYELLLERKKLAEKLNFPANGSFVVKAVNSDGTITDIEAKELTYPDKDKLLLRFVVPQGTKELFLAAGTGQSNAVESKTVDNLFAGILDDASKWQGKDIEIRQGRNSVLLRAKKYGPVTAGCTVAIPRKAAGKTAALELDVKSTSDLAYGTFIRVAQLDKNGKRLSESVTDPRWISHMRPAGVKSTYRVRGFIHPQAAKLRLEITLSTKDSPYDNFGRLMKNPKAHLAAMEVSHAAVRCAGELPFPRYNDSNFADGISGKEGDHSLKIYDSTAFTHVTTSWATWGEDRQIRNGKEWFWPNADGTVECYFKPEDNSKQVTLFDAANIRNSINGQYLPVRNSTFTLNWNAPENRASVMFKDGKDKVHKALFAFPMQLNKWNHVACQWGAQGLSVYLNGKRVYCGKTPVAPIDLKKAKYPSTRMPQNFSVGATVKVARGQHLRSDKTPKFQGDIDLLRISSTIRYKNNFTPEKEFANDIHTRALYNFDRNFTGVSGGGVQWMFGTYDSVRPILARSVEFGGKEVAWFPASLPYGDDPDKVVNRLNYPVIPRRDDFLAARRVVKKSFTMTPGKVVELDIAKQPYMDYIEITADKKTISHPIVMNEGDIDCRSFGDIAKSLESFKGTELEKMYHIFNTMIHASDYFTSHQIDFPAHSDTAMRSTSMALTMLNIYCGFNCGPLNDMLANIFTCSGGAPATRTFGFGHSFQQVFYGNQNRLYDLSAQRFFPKESLEEAASLEDAEFAPNVLRALGTSTDPRRHTFGPDHYIRLTTKMKVLHEPGFQQRVAYDLRPGESMRIYFNNAGLFNDLQSFMFKDYFVLIKPVKDISEAGDSQSVVVDMNKKVRNKARLKVYQSDRIFPHYSNAFLKFDGKPEKSNPAFVKFTAKDFCYKVELPYTVTAAIYAAKSNGKAVPLSISTDGAKTFHPLKLDADGRAVLDYEVRARHGYWIKIAAPVSKVDSFSAVTAMMLNSRIQTGKLHAGVNRIKYNADTATPVKVTLQYRVDDGKIVISGNTYSGAIPGNERQLAVVEPGKTETYEVTGASADTKVTVFGKITAKLENGKLAVTALPADTPSFAAVILDDNGRKKELTVLAAPGARLITSDNGLIAGKGSTMLNPTKERLQKSLAFSKSGALGEIRFAPLDGGKYNVWTLHRAANVSTRMPLLKMEAPNGTTIEAVRTINHGTDFFQAQFGNGYFGRYKWDNAFYLPKGNFFYSIPQCYNLEAGCSSMKLKSIRPVKFELAAVLVIPLPSRAFQTQMVKVLSGLNHEPWKIQADGIFK
ncbi:MAG: hypothetical protein IJW08_10180 [Lentisphaeria bacterium]|nr:hypothetical protein [Lentisphaeria bacterium]